jgi:hypothetical protein
VSLDRFLVKVTQQEKESTDSSDSVSDIESCLFCINHFYMNIF